MSVSLTLQELQERGKNVIHVFVKPYQSSIYHITHTKSVTADVEGYTHHATAPHALIVFLSSLVNYYARISVSE